MLFPAVVILWVIVCVWIKLVSPGSVLFRQTRVGRGGKPFTIYKFRTMTPKAATSIHEHHMETLIKSGRPMLKLDFCGDTRLIKGGLVIRMTGLDELPQFFNIMRGEMSFVGPRPCTACEFPYYDPQDYRRFTVTPGITGLWQVSRTRESTFPEMLAMDGHYAEHGSPWMDIWILMRTPDAVLGQFSSYLRYKMGRPTVRQQTLERTNQAVVKA